MDDLDASDIAELRRALDEERALRQALEVDLQRSAQIGQELLLKNEELEQAVRDHAEKSLQAARRDSAHLVPVVRRACTVPVKGKEASDEDDSDGEGDMTKQARLIRRGRAGKTVMVEELMSANQSLHDDLIRLKDEQRLRGFRETEGMQDDMDVGTMDLQNDGEEGSGGELQSRVAALEAERRQLQKELRASQDKAVQAQRLEEELEAARSSLHLAQGQLAALEEKNRALRISQQALDAERTKLASLLEAAESRCVHLEQELEQTTLARARRSRKSTGSISTIGEEAVPEATSASLAAELAQESHEEAMRLDCIKVASELRAEVGALSRTTASCKAWLVAARKLCDEKLPSTLTLSADRSDDETSP